MRISVIVPSVGRAPVLRETIPWLFEQSHRPHEVIVVGVTEADIEGVAEAAPEAQVERWEKGLCRQRNRGIELMDTNADILVFFDDDFVPRKDFLENLAAAFSGDDTIMGMTGKLIADGIHGEPIEFEDALRMVNTDTAGPDPSPEPVPSLYGCNMAIRVSALGQHRFDEKLPLYGWLEDVDLTFQVGTSGKLVRSGSIRGVHMGSRSGRIPGKRLGYSQIANPVYLLRKQTIPRKAAYRLMAQNVTANVVKSVIPNPAIDRRGRLFGNLLALGDIARGRVDPERILTF